jgi:hypothetical protein
MACCCCKPSSALEILVIVLLLGRPRRRWEDYIKMDLREVGWGGDINWIELAQNRDTWRALLYVVMNLRVP